MTQHADVTERRPWWAHALAVLAVLTVSLVAAVSIVVPWVLASGDFGCSSFDSEYDIADASPRGRFVCGDSSAPDILALVCLGILVALTVAALVVWLRRGRVVVFVLLTVLAGLIPCAAGVTVMALPAECSDEQAATDPEGCAHH